MTGTEPPAESLSPPPISVRQLRWFMAYLTFYLRRNFHAVHLLQLSSPQQVEGWPLLLCANHPSWWDPLMALYLSRHLFPERSQYGPIAAVGLAKYRFFEKLGFFGIEPGTAAGARRFLRIGESILSSPNHALWVTPQGHFTDVRTRPVQIQPGVGHLCHRVGRFAMLPIAFEYSFWNERTPEAFACVGRPVFSEDGRLRSAREWNQSFSAALDQAQTTLSDSVAARNSDAFEPLLSGRSGIGGVYDVWRSFTARLRGKKFEAEHGGI